MTLATIGKSMVFTVCFFFSGFPFFSAAFSYNHQQNTLPQSDGNRKNPPKRLSGIQHTSYELHCQH